MSCFSLPLHFSESEKKCLVLGVNGQDGSYLAEDLLQKGYCVIGIGRQNSSRWVKPHPNFLYQKLNLADVGLFRIFLDEFRPNSILHLAAVHGASGYSYEDEWSDVHLVNTVSVHAVLDYLIKNLALCASLIYVSSSKVFSFGEGGVINENSRRFSNCIYTTSKNAATDLIFFYRNKYKINASVVWTFNHESPRRGSEYFIPKLVNTLALCKGNINYKCELGDLNFWCDWGDASEFMNALSCILDSDSLGDLIIATGKATNATFLAKKLFERHGLDIRSHIIDFNHYSESTDIPPWNVDVSVLKNTLGFIPSKSIIDICDDILMELSIVKNY